MNFENFMLNKRSQSPSIILIYQFRNSPCSFMAIEISRIIIPCWGIGVVLIRKIHKKLSEVMESSINWPVECLYGCMQR